MPPSPNSRSIAGPDGRASPSGSRPVRARDLDEAGSPSGADEETVRSHVRIFKNAATPDMQDHLETVRFDRQSVLSEIRTPTLVLHRRDDLATLFAVGEQCAQQIP